MQLTKTAYYADFVIYAALIGILISIVAVGAHWTERLKWLAALMTGGAAWTLLEYLLHRFVLHRLPVFAAMHAVHHASPRAFVGTPTWITLAILWVVFFLPAWWCISFNVASGLIAGVMIGFLWYGVLHHAIHHGRPRLLASLMSACALRHSRHHYSGRPGNFGVTTRLWDCVFGTAIRVRDSTGPKAARKTEPLHTLATRRQLTVSVRAGDMNRAASLGPLATSQSGFRQSPSEDARAIFSGAQTSFVSETPRVDDVLEAIRQKLASLDYINR